MTQANNTFEGGCTCGEIRYRMTSKPLIVHCCHCSWCQRQSGSAFAVNALIEADRVELIKGAVEEITVDSPSGANQRIARCPVCRVAVWSNYLCLDDGLGEAIRFVKVGSLDTPDQVPPDVHIFTSTRQTWFTLPEDARVFDEFYVHKEVWPADSFKRRVALTRKIQSL